MGCNLLEHIEEPYLEAVLLDLKDITTGPAMKTLPDGRNAHIIQKPSSCWLPRLCQHFEIGHLQRGQGGFWGIVEPKTAILTGFAAACWP